MSDCPWYDLDCEKKDCSECEFYEEYIEDENKELEDKAGSV